MTAPNTTGSLPPGPLPSDLGTKPVGIGVRWNYALAIYIVLFAVAWVLVPLAVNREPPGDNIEQLNWAEHLAWGYDKHPPLPTMVLWIFEQVFPTGEPLTYALGGLQVAMLLGLVWALTRITLDKNRAAMAVLFVSCMTYYTNRLHYYNHNTGLLVAYAMSVYCVLRAAQTQKAFWYALLGVTWGLGMLSKYQMVIGIACNLIFLLGWVARLQLRKFIGLLLVSWFVCAIVITPHVAWLIEHHFPSFDYAAKFVAADLPWWRRPDDIGSFLADQAMRVIPLALVLIILRYLPATRRLRNTQSIVIGDGSNFAAPLLAIHAWGPLVLMSSLSLLFGVDLQMHWGTAFIWVIPIWFLRTPHGRAIASLPLPTVLVAVMILQTIMLLAYRWRY